MRLYLRPIDIRTNKLVYANMLYYVIIYIILIIKLIERIHNNHNEAEEQRHFEQTESESIITHIQLILQEKLELEISKSKRTIDPKIQK